MMAMPSWALFGKSCLLILLNPPLGLAEFVVKATRVWIGF
jgi:hypothetical protein